MSVKDRMSKGMIKIMSERAEKDLGEYLDDMVTTAERVLVDLKDYQKRVNDDKYMEHTTKEKVVQWAINWVQQINWHYDKGADVIGNSMFMKAKKED